MQQTAGNLTTDASPSAPASHEHTAMRSVAVHSGARRGHRNRVSGREIARLHRRLSGARIRRTPHSVGMASGIDLAYDPRAPAQASR